MLIEAVFLVKKGSMEQYYRQNLQKIRALRNLNT